jgi:purine-binding chemotaxis protein CheW
MSTPFSPAQDIDLVTMVVDGAYFGVPVLQVRDVLASPVTHSVPLAPPEIKGSINLRGRIVTAIDLRIRLGMAARPAGARCMCVIVESDETGEPYAFLVDEVGDVLTLTASQYEPTPITLSRDWSDVCLGLYRQEDNLLIVLDTQAVLRINTDTERHAA